MVLTLVFLTLREWSKFQTQVSLLQSPSHGTHTRCHYCPLLLFKRRGEVLCILNPLVHLMQPWSSSCQFYKDSHNLTESLSAPVWLFRDHDGGIRKNVIGRGKNHINATTKQIEHITDCISSVHPMNDLHWKALGCRSGEDEYRETFLS